MKDATQLIIEALNEAEQIQPSGKSSLLGLAARALDPEAKLSRDGLCRALGLHAASVVSLMITADLAGDTNSRRALGEALFPRLPLRGRPPRLTRLGRLAVARWSLEQLGAAGEVEQLALRVCQQAELAVQGQTPDAAALEACRLEALKLQQTKVVPVQKGQKSKMGVSDEEACRRRAAQAVRALADGLQDGGKSSHLCPTVAGEVVWTLGAASGLDSAVEFCVGLAELLRGLPADQVIIRPGNGG